MAEEIVEWITEVARDGRKFKVWNALCHYLSDPLSDDTRLMWLSLDLPGMSRTTQL